MASSAFIAAVRNSLEQLIPETTLIELTNQRRGEVQDLLWDADVAYAEDDVVEHDNKVWVANTATSAGQEPGVHASWDEQVLAVNTDRLEHAIDMAAAEVEPFLMRKDEDELSEDDNLAIGYTGQIAIHRLAKTHAVNTSDLSLQTMDSIMRSLERYQKIRAQRAARVIVKRKPTGAPRDPSGYDPFRNL